MSTTIAVPISTIGAAETAAVSMRLAETEAKVAAAAQLAQSQRGQGNGILTTHIAQESQEGEELRVVTQRTDTTEGSHVTSFVTAASDPTTAPAPACIPTPPTSTSNAADDAADDAAGAAAPQGKTGQKAADPSSMNAEQLHAYGVGLFTGKLCPGLLKDEAGALSFWKRAVSSFAHVESMIALGMAYWHGDGCDQDIPAGLELLRVAGRTGGAKGAAAAHFLGVAYLEAIGVEQDTGRAHRWLRQAAKFQHAEAMFVLGSSLMTGSGRDDPETLRRGCDWVTAAASLGHARAAEFVASVPAAPGGAAAASEEGAAERRNELATGTCTPNTTCDSGSGDGGTGSGGSGAGPVVGPALGTAPEGGDGGSGGGCYGVTGSYGGSNGESYGGSNGGSSYSRGGSRSSRGAYGLRSYGPYAGCTTDADADAITALLEADEEDRRQQAARATGGEATGLCGDFAGGSAGGEDDWLNGLPVPPSKAKATAAAGGSGGKQHGKKKGKAGGRR